MWKNFIVETYVKYLAGMLNNLGKMYNMIINYWVDYIRTNFFFKIVYKKGKTFGLDRLSRKKQYSKNLFLDRFEDSSDNEKKNILILLGKNQEEIPLELEKFYENIDLRKGFSIKDLSKIQSINWI